MKMVSRSLLAAIALAYGVVATAPALASNGSHEPIKVCIKIFHKKICV